MYAQYYNQRPEFLKANSVWAFGTNAGLDFSSGGPVAIQTAITGTEGFASVCDSGTGKLLFYSNGHRCWNANHQVMPNGTGLLGNGRSLVNPGSLISTAQGACIVPIIDSPGKYYLFSLVDKGARADTLTGLYYSIVDMSLDNGSGDIDTTRKNILLNNDLLSEAMIAVPDDNCGIWLILHHATRPEFISYRITAAGIDTIPVVSNTGNLYGGYTTASLTISPDRKKVVISEYRVSQPTTVKFGEFDAGTGLVSNTIEIPPVDSTGSVSATSFSPDNSKLYMAVLSRSGNKLYQYDVNIYDSSMITNSKTDIADLVIMSGLKLYRDTIYIANFLGIHRINRPNLSGAACDFQTNAVSLFPGTFTLASLVSEVVFPLLPLDTVFNTTDTIICSGEHINIRAVHANSGYSYSWNTGDTTSQINISESEQGQNVFWVRYSDGCHNYVDSFRIGFYDVFTTITVNQFELGTTGGPFASYQWLLNGEIIPGANSSTYTVTANGDYRVVVMNENGCADTSDAYPVTNYDVSVAEVNIGADQIRVYPNPAHEVIYINSPVAIAASLTTIDGRTLMQVENPAKITIQNFAQGIYFLRIADKKGRQIKVEKVMIVRN